MTITARQTSTRIHAIRTLVDKLAALPLAVGEIHRAIADDNVDSEQRFHAEDVGIRSKGDHTDPTADKAIRRAMASERHLDDVEANLATLALAAGNLAEVVSRWVRSAASLEEHPRCSGGGTVDEWTRPDCAEYVSYSVRSDGSLSYRQDGLCDSCRMRRHRFERQAEVA